VRGVPVKTASELAGESGLAVTAAIYTRVGAEDKRSAMSKAWD
jgi:hypothetical protein